MSWVEAAGYLASVLVFSTFCMKTMVPLRCVAIASNVAFIVYGLFGGLHPVLALHLLLLPLNVVRLVQVRRLAIRIREAVGADPSLEALAPLLEKRTFERGAVLFRKGDPASTLHVLVRGDIRLPELGITLRDRGTVVGEIGIFSPFHQRTASAICATEVETLTIGEAEVVRHYFRDPRFGLSLARLMVRRLLTVPAHVAAGEVPGAAMRERA